MAKIPLEKKHKIIEDLKNNVNIKEIINTYNISKSTLFRIKKEIENEKVNETEPEINEIESNNDEKETEKESNESENDEKEPNNVGYPVSLTYLGYSTQKTL